MARRTKAEKFDIEIEAALEEALDFDFDDDALDTNLKADTSGAGIVPAGCSRTEAEENSRHLTSGSFSESRLSADEEKRTELLDLDIANLEQQIALATEDLERAQVAHSLVHKSSGIPITAPVANHKQKAAGFSMSADSFSLSAISIPVDLQDHPEETRNAGRKSSVTIEIADNTGGIPPGPGFNELAGADGGDGGDGLGRPPLIMKKSGRKMRSRLGRDLLYWSTTALSAMWAVGGIAAAYRFSSSSSIDGLSSFLSSAQGMLIAAGTIVPILMFWGFAQLARRAKELQQALNTMTGAVLRLLEPETTSKEHVASLGHSIRCEVSAMSEGIDRVMSRASELEALLQSEVNNLEQAYSENETRIRTLIVEFANEREAVSTHADHVKTKITGAKDQLTQEFNSIADHINATAESFTTTLSETLNARWGELVSEFNMADEDMAQQLSKKFIEIVQSFDASRGRFFEELDTRFAQIDQHTEEASKAVAERLGTKIDDFIKIVHERTEDVEGHFDTLTGRLANSGKKIIEAVDESVAEIEKRSDDIDLRLRSTADKVLNDFDNKFQKLDNAIIDRGNQSLVEFSEQVGRLESQANDLTSVFDNLAETAVDEFAQQINRVEEQFNQLSVRLGKNGSDLTETLTNSLNEIGQCSDDVSSRLDTAANKILDAFENNFNKVDHTFIDRSNHSLNEFSTQIEKLEQKVGNVSSSFDSATTLAVQAFEKRLTQIDDSLSQRSTSLIQSFISRTEALEENTERLNAALETHVGRVNEAFQSRTRDIVETLSGGRNDILSIIDETKIRLSHEMEIVGITIGKLVDERAGGFIHQFIEGREKLSNILEMETTRIIDTVNKQINTLSRHVSDMEDILLKGVTVLDEQACKHVENLDRKTVAFEKTVVNSFNTACESIETQAKNIDISADALRNSLSLNSETLNQVLGEQTNILEERIARIRDVIADSNVCLTDSMNSHLLFFRESVHSNDESLREVLINHLRNLEDQTARIKNAFNDNQISLIESLDNRIDAFQNSLTSSQTAIEEVLSSHGLIVSDRAVELQNNLVQTLSSAEEKLNHQGKILDKRSHELCDAVDYNNSVLEDSFRRQTAVIDERTKTMQKAIEIGVGNVRSVLENNALSLSETLREGVSEVSGTLSNETQRAETVISSATAYLMDSIARAVDDVDQKFADRALFLKDNVSQVGDQLDMGMANIESRFVHIASSLTKEAEKAGNIISDSGMRLSGSVTRATEDADRVFADRASVLRGTIQDIEGQIHTGISVIENRMLEATQDVEQKLSDRSLSLKENIHQIEDLISTGIGSIEGRISEITQNTAQQLIGQTENLHSLAEHLKNAATRTSDSLGTLTGQFNKQLQEVTGAAEERLRSENETFISNFSSRTEETVSVVQSARSEIENHIAQLLERLDASSGSIHFTVNTLRNSVSEVDAHLIDVTSGFKQNIGQLAERFISSSNVLNDDLQRFTSLSQNALDNVAKFSEQFDAHAKLLTKATEILDNSNNLFTEKLETRQEALNTLASGLISKSDEIADVMQNCEQIISSVIKSAEDRAWTSTTQIQSSLSDLINEASGKFEDATEEIRKSAEEIREELVRTRADLNRGVRTLPTQTKKYTDAMRKAVMEQIEALKELSGIVEESGRLFEVSQPAGNSNGATMLKQRTQRIMPTPPSASRPAQTAQQTFATASATAAIDIVNNAPKEADKVFQSVSRPESSSASKAAQSRGWVSDLLARASKDDLEPSSATGVQTQRAGNSAETLNSMSADIVQAIDRNAIIQLWRHYRRGQRNIYANRLYTAEGNRTFEKIKHKYALDGDFRRAVGQYITDFERLLGEVTKNGGNNNTVREYLTSDTGKVYTMLAHVSGRIQ